MKHTPTADADVLVATLRFYAPHVEEHPHTVMEQVARELRERYARTGIDEGTRQPVDDPRHEAVIAVLEAVLEACLDRMSRGNLQ